MPPGPKPIGERAMTPAERQARRRAVLAVTAKPPVKVIYRRPADRRSKPQRWAAAVEALSYILDDYQNWRDSLPPGLEDSAIAQRLDDVLELRDLVDQLQDADLPRGFGRD